MNKITIAVVTFRKDVDLLERLLKSIYKHWDKSQIDSIKIVFNDKQIYKPKLDAMLHQFDSTFKIDVHNALELEPRIEGRYDWSSQQLLKCLIANKITTEWYLIHDCKDFYTEDVSLSDCFVENKPTMPIDQTRPSYESELTFPTHYGFGPFPKAFQMSFDLFGVDSRDHEFERFHSVTPFFTNTQIMNDMVYEVKNITKGLFPYLFALNVDGQFAFTEFLLYSAYCAMHDKYKLYEDFSVNDKKFFKKVEQNKELRKNNKGVQQLLPDNLDR